VPTYQYACAACEERLEAVQKFTDDPLTECPACGGKLRKLFSPVGIVFKGSGFYRTDSRSSANGSKSSADSGSSAESSSPADKPSSADKKGSSSSSESSGDSKPAAKTDSASSAKPAGTGTKVA
jgi:putative FmdB family regulatory protein